MLEWSLLSLLFLILCIIVLFPVHTMVHLLKGRIILAKEHYALLLQLAEQSLASSDVPVGALLLNEGKVIGRGFNTVLRNAKAGEHAEVNAISDAIAGMGMEKFSLLDRRSLVLVSTFEPCLMCAGACINYNIRNVYFMKEKDLSYTRKEEIFFIRYLLQRKQIKNNREQDDLFEKHPDYPVKKK